MLAGTDPHPGISLPSYVSHVVWTREGGNSSPVCWTGTSLGGLQAEYKEKDKRPLDNQHMAMWRVLRSTQRQTRKLVSGPSLTARTIIEGYLLPSTGYNAYEMKLMCTTCNLF